MEEYSERLKAQYVFLGIKHKGCVDKFRQSSLYFFSPTSQQAFCDTIGKANAAVVLAELYPAIPEFATIAIELYQTAITFAQQVRSNARIRPANKGKPLYLPIHFGNMNICYLRLATQAFLRAEKEREEKTKTQYYTNALGHLSNAVEQTHLNLPKEIANGKLTRIIFFRACIHERLKDYDKATADLRSFLTCKKTIDMTGSCLNYSTPKNIGTLYKQLEARASLGSSKWVLSYTPNEELLPNYEPALTKAKFLPTLQEPITRYQETLLTGIAALSACLARGDIRGICSLINEHIRADTMDELYYDFLLASVEHVMDVRYGHYRLPTKTSEAKIEIASPDKEPIVRKATAMAQPIKKSKSPSYRRVQSIGTPAPILEISDAKVPAKTSEKKSSQTKIVQLTLAAKLRKQLNERADQEERKRREQHKHDHIRKRDKRARLQAIALAALEAKKEELKKDQNRLEAQSAASVLSTSSAPTVEKVIPASEATAAATALSMPPIPDTKTVLDASESERKTSSVITATVAVSDKLTPPPLVTVVLSEKSHTEIVVEEKKPSAAIDTPTAAVSAIPSVTHTATPEATPVSAFSAPSTSNQSRPALSPDSSVGERKLPTLQTLLTGFAAAASVEQLLDLVHTVNGEAKTEVWLCGSFVCRARREMKGTTITPSDLDLIIPCSTEDMEQKVIAAIRKHPLGCSVEDKGDYYTVKAPLNTHPPRSVDITVRKKSYKETPDPLPDTEEKYLLLASGELRHRPEQDELKKLLDLDQHLNHYRISFARVESRWPEMIDFLPRFMKFHLRKINDGVCPYREILIALFIPKSEWLTELLKKQLAINPTKLFKEMAKFRSEGYFTILNAQPIIDTFIHVLLSCVFNDSEITDTMLYAFKRIMFYNLALFPNFWEFDKAIINTFSEYFSTPTHRFSPNLACDLLQIPRLPPEMASTHSLMATSSVPVLATSAIVTLR